MFGIAVALVLCSGFLHAVWNLFTKKSGDKNAFLWYCQLVAVVVFLPWTLYEWEGSALRGVGGLAVIGSMALHGLYVRLLAAAYESGDLSQTYPIMRGTSPLLVPLAGVLLLHEELSAVGWLGVAAIVSGMLGLSNFRFVRGAPSGKAPLLAFAVGVAISAYIVVDKVALGYVPAVVLNEATNVGNLAALTWIAWRSGHMASELRVNWKTIMLGGILAPGAYILFLSALALAPVTQLAPMREIGTVFGAALGLWLLKEKQGMRRLATSLLITTGVIVLGIWG
ncbi:Permease of the drug/metabolite transporter (DMT) superfamily [Cohnella sp. OV330]|uniref:DMT family transporter n=1 Tax=Cohnella sp. OV330 TaxID=1855288 RepID=UPI0008E277C9|nr:DMT family transporter [Cohnella sp. OV330]SFA72267.1 Permease of the drug/metabolite transporter (DMT) superfamily [Cohnella sp. OV330]